MKKILVTAALGLLVLHTYSQDTKTAARDAGLIPDTTLKADRTDRTNDFYDNEVTYRLPQVPLEIAGEVENPGMVDLSKLAKHPVIVKETLLKDDGSDSFVGAYRYNGYSLYDILNGIILKKRNKAEFSPIIDLYVEIENARGEKAVISWGEIYYPNFLHNIIIATDVMRIVPSKTKELWPLPAESRLVIATDLVTERNLSGPSRITVKSYPRSFAVNREMKPLISQEIILHGKNGVIRKMAAFPGTLQDETLHTVFYGKGRGIHSTQPFTGKYLKGIIAADFPFSRANLKQGLVAIVGKDGYRSVYTYSEIMNRNDQAEVLVVPAPEDEDGGKFRIFPSCDFFSDRAVKAVSDIYLELEK